MSIAHEVNPFFVRMDSGQLLGWCKQMDLVTTPSVKLAEDPTMYLCLIFKHEITSASCQAWIIRDLHHGFCCP